MRKKGFTIIELLVVIAIIGILVSLAMVMLKSVQAKSRDTERIADIGQLRKALEMYILDNSTYPSAITPGVALTSPDSSITYLKKVPSNPFPRTDGGCPDQEYSYTNYGNVSYSISYCLSAANGEIPAGSIIANAGSSGAAPCTANCSGKTCGNDGCGGSCGTCSGGTPYCSGSSTCVACTDDSHCAANKRCSSNSCIDNCTVSSRTCASTCGTGSTCSNGTLYWTNGTQYKIYSRDGSASSTACTPSCLSGWSAGNTAEMQTADTALNLAAGTAYVTSDCSGVDTGLACGSGYPCFGAWVNWSGNWGGCLKGSVCTVGTSYAFCYKLLSF